MTERERIEPSKKAMEAFLGWINEDDLYYHECLGPALSKAYAIDFTQLQAERDQLRQENVRLRGLLNEFNDSGIKMAQERDQLRLELQEAQESYDKLANRANQLERLVGAIADLLRRDMTDE